MRDDELRARGPASRARAGQPRPLVVLLALCLPWAARPSPTIAADDAPAAIAFITSLPVAFDTAKAEDKPLMICINSHSVVGERREPAAQELREHTYKDPAIVELSRKFVCAFLTAEGSADDFGELRARFSIDGDIVSPQHLFAYPDGKLIYRKEFWPYGRGDQAVKALKEMMEKALAEDHARRGAATPAPGEAPGAPDAGGPPVVPAAPEDPTARQAWIEKQLAIAKGPDPISRRASLRALVEADQKGDVVAQLVALLDTSKKDVPVAVDIVRVLGRPGLEAAREPIEGFLDSREDTLRANAAVSLEYIGSAASASAILKQAGHEKDDAIANHLYRALGRCGAGEDRYRKALEKRVQSAKEPFGSYGAIIGLAYFGKDGKTCREVEKLLKKESVGGRGAWKNGGKRSLLAWCLTETGDDKSATFVEEEIVPGVGNGPWSKQILAFYRSVEDALQGKDGAKDDVVRGVQFALGRDEVSLQDDARADRDGTGFTPKADTFGSGS